MLSRVSRPFRPISTLSRLLSTGLDFATVDPSSLSAENPHTVSNLVGGEWRGGGGSFWIRDPLAGGEFLEIPAPNSSDVSAFASIARSVPKSGVHNPLKRPERYVELGGVSGRVGARLGEEEVADFFARLVQRVSPKSYAEARKEVLVTGRFLENFASDNVRFMSRGFVVSGDRAGQESVGYRWPFGPVAIITPFNFPIEIPALQLFGALFMGNHPTLHVDHRVCVVMEQFLRLCIDCGLDPSAVDMLNGPGSAMGEFLHQAPPRNTLFTGSSRVAEMLSAQLGGKVMLEDAGFDWKVLGPDIAAQGESMVEYVAWQCDQDAYACSGQKCSAQSLLAMHQAWSDTDLLDRMRALAQRRQLEDLTIGPVLTWTTEAMLEHVDCVASLPGAEVLWGGKALEGHSIPPEYGAMEATAVRVPLESILASEENFATATKELFGPFQVVTEFSDDSLPDLLAAFEKMPHHLTAAVVSNDPVFRNHVLANTVNGTTYAGALARTTGAPQNHWFGPAGDPRGAGIGTPEAIRLVWSTHREIIRDEGPMPSNFKTPPPA